jgi:sugar lactone lactonase YvrE
MKLYHSGISQLQISIVFLLFTETNRCKPTQKFMKKAVFLLLLAMLAGCKKSQNATKESLQSNDKNEPVLVASFKGQQVTGVTVTNQGRVFANFPRWRAGVKSSVVEVINDKAKPYPDKGWNRWELGEALNDSVFVAVQSVVAIKKKLYVLDTRNPLFQGVQGAPRVFVFNLENDRLDHIYVFDEEGFHADSYINDLRIDEKHGKAYFTDSGHAGLVVLDLETGKTKRVLDNHYSTLAETNELIIEGVPWQNTVHSDGIALDAKNERLYYHALTGYTLYAIPTRVLSYGTASEAEKSVFKIQKTPAPDGMIFDEKGNLYLADLEKNKIMARDKSGNLTVITSGENVRWADTFSIYNGELYYSNSRIHEAKADIADLNFTIYKIKIK